MRRTRITLATVGLLVVAACGGTGSEEPAAEDTAADTTAPAGETLEVTAQDYAFQGIPDTVASGTQFRLTNASSVEAHEMVVVRVTDGEDRPLQELLELPEEESEGLVEFQGVLVALPEEDGANPEGEGDTITVTEPGRYAVVCFIPQGADPAAMEEAMAGGEAEGPPDMGEGTPHAFLGMVDEFTVEG